MRIIKLVIRIQPIFYCQVHIVYAITVETEVILPIDISGTARTSFSSASDVWPLIGFVLGLVSSSYGMSKFLLLVPIDNKPINTLCSPRFLGMIFLNTFFVVRIYSIDNILFAYYVFYPNNMKDGSLDPSVAIKPLLTSNFKNVRLLIYLLPSYFSIVANLIRLKYTRVSLKRLLMDTPQILILSGFSPVMFERSSLSKIHQSGNNKLQIWRYGSVINGIYICIVPLVALIISEHTRGITELDLNPIQEIETKYSSASFNLLLNSGKANVIFASVFGLLSGLIVFALFSKRFECSRETPSSSKNNDISEKFIET